jgi:hypothetical protein
MVPVDLEKYVAVEYRCKNSISQASNVIKEGKTLGI